MADALVQATKENFSLYLHDYHLPDGTGFELCLLIKNFDTDTPILFFTGTSSITEEQVLKIRAQGLIKKGKASFPDELKRRVSELLEK